MISLLSGVLAAMAASLFSLPLLARSTKHGTGGAVVLVSTTVGYAVSAMVTTTNNVTNRSGTLGWIILYLMAAFAAIGLIQEARGSLSRRKLWAYRSAIVASIALIALATRDTITEAAVLSGTLGTDDLSRPHPWLLLIAAVLLVVLLSVIWGKGVQSTDTYSNLAAGCVSIALLAYVIIAHVDSNGSFELRQVSTPNMQSLANLAASAAGACIGFIWWNAPGWMVPLGKSGAFAFGTLIGALSFFTNTVFLAVMINGTISMALLSILIQFVALKLTGRRVFRAVPIQLHFEAAGWRKSATLVRFWILAIVSAIAGLTIFHYF